jgi:hypothetical protein
MMEFIHEGFKDHVRLFAPKIENPEHLTLLKREINLMFGGSTVYDGFGSWNSPKGELINEPVEIIDIWCNNLDSLITSLMIKVRAWAYATQQETIGIEINNRFYIIPTAFTGVDIRS